MNNMNVMSQLSQRIHQIFDKIKRQINDQLSDYRQSQFIRRNKESKTKTVFATIIYILSMIVLIPSIIHIVVDSVLHLTTSSLSVTFYQLSTYIRG